MKKVILSFAVLVTPAIIYAQNSNDSLPTIVMKIKDFPFLQNADSVKIFFEMYYDKEISEPPPPPPLGDTIATILMYEEPKLDTMTFLKTDTGNPTVTYSENARLSRQEIDQLSHLVLDSRNYTNERPLLNYEDISVLYYQNGRAIQYLYISTITRRVTVSRDDRNIIFENRINKRFEDFITNLMIKKGLWDKGSTFMPY